MLLDFLHISLCTDDKILFVFGAYGYSLWQQNETHKADLNNNILVLI